MFAVVRTGGKQYRVAPGDKIVVEKLDGDAGDTVTLGDVLLAGEGSDLGSTDGLKVTAEIIAQAKGEKVTVFKKRRRQNYRRKKGHRQQHTILRIVAIGDKKAEKPAKPKAEAAPKAKKPAEKGEASKKTPEQAAEKKAAPAKAEKGDSGKPKAEKKAAPAKAKGESTKKAAPAKGAAKKDTKSKK
jgi:large subunit ribosomal protein L21